MKHIELIGELESGGEIGKGGEKQISQLFDGPFRRIVGVRLRNNAVLSRHHADVPITVYCISGTGRFSAGADLHETQELRAGTLITLEAGIEHEVVADPELHILVSKFKNS